MFIICNFLRLQSLLLEPYMPSTSAKINYLLGLEHRSKHDNILGKILIDTDFKTTLLGLLGNSKGIKKPIRLFRKYTEAEMVAWQDKFKGKQGQ